MLMRFCGYGIGHTGQTKFVEPSDQGGDQNDLEEDNLDLQNMARIAQSQYVQPVLHVHTEETVDCTQDGDDDPSADDSDAVSDDDDLNGHF